MKDDDHAHMIIVHNYHEIAKVENSFKQHSRRVALLMIDLTSFQLTEKPFKYFINKKSNQALSVGIFFLPYPVELTTRWLIWRLVLFFFQHLLRNDIYRNIKWIFRQIQTR